MAHRRYEWQRRIEATVREYQAVRVALDLLKQSAFEEIRGMTEERGWDNLSDAEIYAAERHIDATYVIRVYSVFERAVGSFWRQIPGYESRPDDGEQMLREVGESESIRSTIVASAQEVRGHRNNLVHRRIEAYAATMTMENASQDLMSFLESLPETWS